MNGLFEHERFAALTPEDISELAPTLTEQVLGRDELLFREGDPSEGVFLVVEGVIRIYSEVDGAVVELNRLIAGEVFGEQSLLPGRRRARGASARALLRTRLVKAPVQVLERVLQRDAEVLAEMERKGAAQARHGILRRSHLFRLFELSADEVHASGVALGDGEQLFGRGEPSDTVYLVVAGELDVLGADAEVLNRVRAGDVVGELAALDNAPRSATLVARGAVELLELTAAEFKKRYASSDALRQRLTQQRRGYRFDRGYARQYTEQVLGQQQHTTVVDLTDGRQLVASRREGSDGFRVSVKGRQDQGQHLSNLTHHGPDGALWFSLELASETPDGPAVLVGFETAVDNPSTSALYALALDDVPLTAAMRAALTLRGALDSPPAPRDPKVLCRCLSVTVDQVNRVIASGETSASAVCERTGCGTVCGACRPRVAELVTEAAWTPTRLQEVVPLAAGLTALRFVPTRGGVRSQRAGQEVQLRVKQGGTWSQGAFALTSPAEHAPWVEVAVRGGTEDPLARKLLSLQPGECGVEFAPAHGRGAPADGVPVVCFVAEHGVGPALSLARTRIHGGGAVVIHWSVPSRAQAPWLEELEAHARSEQVSLEVLETQLDGRLGFETVDPLVRARPDAVFLISGPGDFPDRVASRLDAMNVPAERVWLVSLSGTPGAAERVVSSPPPVDAAAQRDALRRLGDMIGPVVGNMMAVLELNRPLLVIAGVLMLPLLIWWSLTAGLVAAVVLALMAARDVQKAHLEWVDLFHETTSDPMVIARGERRPAGFSDGEVPAIRGILMHRLSFAQWLSYKYTLRLDYTLNDLVRFTRHVLRLKALELGWSSAISWEPLYQPFWSEVPRQIAEGVLETSLCIGLVSMTRHEDGHREAVFRYDDWICPAGPEYEHEALDVRSLEVTLDPDRRVALRCVLNGEDVGLGNDALALVNLALVTYHHPVMHAYANWACDPNHSDAALRQASIFTLSINGTAIYSGGVTNQDPGTFRRMLAYNGAKGIYRHGSGRLLTELLGVSRFAAFIMKVRGPIMETLNRHQVNVDAEAFFLMSVMHSLDHHFAAVCFDPKDLRSELLNYEGAERIRVLFTAPLKGVFVNTKLSSREEPWVKDVYACLHAADPEMAALVDYCISY